MSMTGECSALEALSAASEADCQTWTDAGAPESEKHSRISPRRSAVATTGRCEW